MAANIKHETIKEEISYQSEDDDDDSDDSDDSESGAEKFKSARQSVGGISLEDVTSAHKNGE